MGSPVSAFALHIWFDLNRSGECKELNRRLNAIKKLMNVIPHSDYIDMLDNLMKDYEAENSSRFIYAMTHAGSFQAKMDLLARLPGM